MRKLFGTDGIRGRADDVFPDEFVERLGRGKLTGVLFDRRRRSGPPEPRDIAHPCETMTEQILDLLRAERAALPEMPDQLRNDFHEQATIRQKHTKGMKSSGRRRRLIPLY